MGLTVWEMAETSGKHAGNSTSVASARDFQPDSMAFIAPFEWNSFPVLLWCITRTYANGAPVNFFTAAFLFWYTESMDPISGSTEGPCPPMKY